MTVSADAEKLNINTSGILYKLIIGAALLIDIIGVAVQEMHIFFFYISIIKKMNMHKCVIAVFVVFGQSHIFIKVKSFDIFKTYKSVFILLANIFISRYRRRSRGKSEYDTRLCIDGFYKFRADLFSYFFGIVINFDFHVFHSVCFKLINAYYYSITKTFFNIYLPVAQNMIQLIKSEYGGKP